MDSGSFAAALSAKNMWSNAVDCAEFIQPMNNSRSFTRPSAKGKLIAFAIAATATNGGAGKKRRRGRQTTHGELDENLQPRTGHAMTTIELPNAGGSLTLSGTFNMFELAGDERDLVFGVIDKMKAFEGKTTKEDA